MTTLQFSSVYNKNLYCLPKNNWHFGCVCVCVSAHWHDAHVYLIHGGYLMKGNKLWTAVEDVSSFAVFHFKHHYISSCCVVILRGALICCFIIQACYGYNVCEVWDSSVQIIIIQSVWPYPIGKKKKKLQRQYDQVTFQKLYLVLLHFYIQCKNWSPVSSQLWWDQTSPVVLFCPSSCMPCPLSLLQATKGWKELRRFNSLAAAGQ